MKLNIHDFTPREPLTEAQEQYWREQLVIAENKVSYARRMLGQTALPNRHTQRFGNPDEPMFKQVEPGEGEE